MSLSENEYRVLNVILKDPSLSYTDIAQTLNLSVTSIRNLLFSLMEYEETSAFEDDNETKLKTSNIEEVLEHKKTNNLTFHAKYKYDLLSLSRFDFFINCSSLDQINNVIKFCRAHPYTNFRGRIHGGENGVYIVFYMPEEILDMLIFSLDLLKKEGLILDFSQIIHSSSFLIFSLLKIDIFDINEKKWNFDFNNFKQNFAKFKGNVVNYFEKSREKSILQKLDKIDIMILSEWGYGAGPRKTKAELLNNITNNKIYGNFTKDLKLNRYIISDHVDSLLKHNIINQFGIGFDRRKIQILTTLFFMGEADFEFLNAFSNYIKSDEFPFDSTLNVGDLDMNSKTANYSWWVSLTANIVSKFTEFLYENSVQLKTFIATNAAKDRISYALYHGNFIQDEANNNHWNISEENCLINPLKDLVNADKLQSISGDFQKFRNGIKDKN